MRIGVQKEFDHREKGQGSLGLEIDTGTMMEGSGHSGGGCRAELCYEWNAMLTVL